VKRATAGSVVVALVFGLVGCSGSEAGTHVKHSPKVAMALSKGARPHITAGIEIVKFIGELALGGSVSLKEPEKDWMRLVIQDRSNGGRETVYDVQLPDSFKVVMKGRTEITKAAESRTVTIDITDGGIESLEFVTGASGTPLRSGSSTVQRVADVVCLLGAVLTLVGSGFIYKAVKNGGDGEAVGAAFGVGFIALAVGGSMLAILYIAGYKFG
jgi:hypothetical protein